MGGDACRGNRRRRSCVRERELMGRVVEGPYGRAGHQKALEWWNRANAGKCHSGTGSHT